MSETLRLTPLHDRHLALGAKMMPFAGFDMPVQYSSILAEHRAVREAAGLFDVSHMGEVLVSGPEARSFVQYLVSNDVNRLHDGKAMYAVLCNEAGGAVDDLLVYQYTEAAYLLVINAANIDKDLRHINGVHAARDWDCTVQDVSDLMALLALQGPASVAILSRLTDLPVSEVPYYQFIRPEPGTFLGCEKVTLSRTGYTGEIGFEIYCDAACAPSIWDALLREGADLGLLPVGLGARDTLRLESGFCLYGHELTDETTPLEAGLGWVTKLETTDGTPIDFVGAGAIREQKAAGVPRKLIGFVIEGRGIAREGYSLVDAEGAEIGTVTSGSQSPALGAGIGLGYVPNDPAFTAPGSRLGVQVRSRTLPVIVTKPPFHKQKRS
ncbi:MAG: glycine cleavage system aminomethyltransferase GcvT [Bacteroidota bacterium]